MSSQGVLLVNLGSPEAPTAPAVRRFLRQFLMDRRVLDAPWPIRLGIVHLAIVPFRARRSAEAYRKIWWPEGPPLLVISQRVKKALRERVPVPVELAMRYQNPSVAEALRSLARQGVKDLLLIPQFPHYAMSSYETAVVEVQSVLAKSRPEIRLSVTPPYPDHPDYVRALTGSAEPYLSAGYDHLLFSFHGLPERHLRKADPTGQHCLRVKNCCEVASPAHRTCYRAQCFATVRAFVHGAQVPADRYSVAFQSRLGRDPWLAPFTDREIERLARAGVKRLLVICPAFVTDCLETLEEIGLRGAESFRAARGDSLVLIPALNDHPLWLEAQANWIKAFLRPAAA